MVSLDAGKEVAGLQGRYEPDMEARDHEHIPRLRLAGTLPDEVVPTVNNQRDAVVAVVPEKLRVLLLDAVPRWETRFAINILRRLPFADVNAIVASTRPDGRLERDVRRGTWPADDATLSLYCVVILGDLPADTLTQGERNSLDRWVNHQGGTLVQLAAGVPIAVPPMGL